MTKGAIHGMSKDQMEMIRAHTTPTWRQIAVSDSHCGAGSLIGDIIAEFSLFALGWTLFRMPLYAEYAGDLLPASLFWRSLSTLRESQILAVPTSRRAEGA